MSKISVLLIICAFLVTGCTGKKAETKKPLSDAEKKLCGALDKRFQKASEDYKTLGVVDDKFSIEKEKLPVINVPYGKMTILSFPGEIVSVAIFPDTLFKIDTIKKDIYITPLIKEGEINLSCWTEKRGYSFHLVIEPAGKVDYKINIEDVIKEEKI